MPFKIFQENPELWISVLKYAQQGKILIQYHYDKFDENVINDLLSNYTFNTKARRKKSKAKDKQKNNKLALIIDKWENYYKGVIKSTIQKFKDYIISRIFQNLREEALKSIEQK